jgi:hypothetical protein
VAEKILGGVVFCEDFDRFLEEVARVIDLRFQRFF